ncbi:MAG TPA: elongation factor G [Bacteroidales bacterium]|nr:MAG: elongation factor G [Bacteroidetes bacterium GWF2_33_38]OFY90525.1 MAG: elongation factor G [Bacteroidetes bacterium RIFOXYA2_FULL_33_7]HBF87867.1 elongation factor G [Bacteroidales bacterium]
MKTYSTEQIRNIAILGNSRSGKTTFSEAMLFEGGVIDRRGQVEAKNTVSDYNDIEHENGNSVFTSVLCAEHNNCKINIIDPPGADDFIGGVVTALHVTDLGLMLLNCQNGIEVGTEIQMRYLKNSPRPLFFALNQLDSDKANFDKTVEQAKERIGGKFVLAQYPVETGLGFKSIIDLISMKMYTYSADGGKPVISEIPASEKDKADELLNELVEKAAESDETLMELFFENGTLTEEEMAKGLAKGLLQGDIYPAFCASAKKNMGISRIMDFITTSGPNPSQMPAIKNSEGAEVKVDSKGSPAIFVFKTSIEEHIGEINYFKVISGKLTESIDLVNYNTSTKERLSQLYVSAGKIRNKVTEVSAGDICASVKLKNTKLNHTLTASNNSFKFDAIKFPEPKFRTAIKTLSEGDEEKLGEALNRMHVEDPTISVEYSKELKQILVFGQGEFHLNMLKWHLVNKFKLTTEFIAPKIPYRETITKVAQADYRHKKQSGGAGQFGEVHMIIEPFIEGAPDPTMHKINGKEYKISIRDKEEHILSWGGKLVYYNCIVGGSIDARFLPAILKGIMEKMEEGPLTGSYARDIKVFVYDGKMHPVDSNEISFRLAGRNAFREAFKIAGPKILEPIYDVEVIVPSDYMGDVMSDLTGRRGIVQGMSSEGMYGKITARVPLAEMNKYSTVLSSITAGRAMYSMTYSEYAPVPGDVQEQLLKTYEAEEKEE